MKVEFKNEVISASAGSGKTYQLATRFIRLMYRGVEPERIIAMTFTNKAAGEIFDKIVNRLLECIHDSGKLESLSKTPGFEGIAACDLKAILKKLILSSHLIRISTLDSFFFSILSSFPYELGISGRISIQSERESRLIKMKVLKEILMNPNEGDRQSFMEEFKRATFGEELKTIRGAMDNFIDNAFLRVMEAPEEQLWGHVDDILTPAYYGQLAVLNAKEMETLAGKLMSLIEAPGEDAFIEEAEKFIRDVKTATVENPGMGKLNAFAGKLTEILAVWECGDSSIKLRRKAPYVIPAKAVSIFKTLWNHILKCHIDNAAHTTKGIYNILKQYESRYSDHIKYTGRMSFADVLFALYSGRHQIAYGDSTTPNRSEIKLNIDYRLDARFDHWLLDEFQDTSATQWDVIRDLVMEVVQDPSGRRSFFYVGDVKQSIYQWREGEPGLFEDVRVLCGDIQSTPLNDSYRSAKQIISAVNIVFDKVASNGLQGLPRPIPEEAATRLSWRRHNHKKDYGGFVAMIDIPKMEDSDTAATIKMKAAVIASEIIRINPFERGLSVGILVKENQFGEELVDSLKQSLGSIDVTLEGKRSPCDNMIVSAILALLKLAAHPDNAYCREYLRMTPLLEFMGGDPEAFAASQLGIIQKTGFSEFIEEWKKKLLDKNIIRHDDMFHIRRLDHLAKIADELDASGNRSCDDFISAIGKYKIPSASLANSVQVMTIYKAKGLEFDIVLLPQLKFSKGAIFTTSKSGIRVKRDGRHEPEWCLDMPAKEIARKIPVFEEFYRCEETDAVYENLCLLYVCMTRAKRALYMLVDPPGKETVNLGDIPRMALSRDCSGEDRSWLKEEDMGVTLLYSEGMHDWFESEPASNERSSPTPTPVLKFSFDGKPQHQTPSGSENWTVYASDIFKFNFSLELGNAVHELFSLFEWADVSATSETVDSWMRSNPPYSVDTVRTAATVFIKAMKNAEIAEVFMRPQGRDIELWRERSFEMVLGNRHVSGVFDRVAIVRDSSGKAVSAEIYDFKTGKPEEPVKAAETYRPQMEIYEETLSKMLNIPFSSIRKYLLFVEKAAIVEID